MTLCCPPTETKASEFKNLPPLAHVQNSVAIKKAIKAMSTDSSKNKKQVEHEEALPIRGKCKGCLREMDRYYTYDIRKLTQQAQ